MLEVLEKAYKNNYAIPQFNINNLEWTKYILEECNKQSSPVILGVSLGAIKYMGGYNTVVNMVHGLIHDLDIKIPVIIHLDHAPTYFDCQKAVDAGFDSVMIDASLKPLTENIEITNQVSSYAKKHNCLVEAEIGHIYDHENINYTSIEDATNFKDHTNIDMLAASFGTAHGPYKSTPNVNFDLIKSIKETTNIPLVLHGGSGLSHETIKKCVKSGINKINFNTELQQAWASAIRKFLQENKEVYDPRKIISSGEKAIKEVVSNYVKLLKSSGRY